MLTWKKPSTGLDVGNRNVKCVQLAKQNGQIVLENLFFLDLAEANQLYPRQSNLAQKLSAAAETHRVKNAKVYAASGQVQMLDLSLAAMPKKELKLVIEKNLETLNLKGEELIYDHALIQGHTPPVTRVFYTKKKETVETVESITSAELKPLRLTANFLALCELLAFNGYTSSDKAHVLVDMGETGTTCSLIAGHDVITTYNCGSGMRLISDTLMEAKSCSYETAEQAKKYIRNPKEIGDEVAVQALESTYRTVLEDIMGALEYFFAQDLGAPISKIYVTGGGSLVGSPAQFLEEHFKTPTSPINPFKNVVTLKPTGEVVAPELLKSWSPFMSTACGLALGGLDW